MKTLDASKARTDLYQLLDDIADSDMPVLITGERHNAVLMSQQHWESLQATLQLLSVPGMRESIRDGMSEPWQDINPLDW